jgi:hypothetical protein
MKNLIIVTLHPTDYRVIPCCDDGAPVIQAGGRQDTSAMATLGIDERLPGILCRGQWLQAL